jgi:hypothetical protein
MEAWRLCRPVVVDLNHHDEEQDPDPEPREVKSWIRIWTRIKVMRIRNSVSKSTLRVIVLLRISTCFLVFKE